MRCRSALLTLSLLACVVLAPGVVPAGWAQDSAPTTSLKLGTASQTVPPGTMLKIAFQSQMDSRITQGGEPFLAHLAQDFYANQRLVLPQGAVIRGRVGQVKRPGLFSRGGSIALDFDHVMLPSGDLIPLTLQLSAENQGVKTMVAGKQKEQRSVLYADPGIPAKLEAGVQRGKQTFDQITQRGVEAGRQTAGGLGSIVTVPAAVVGGALAGTAVTTGQAAVAVVGRGESVLIKPGDTVTIDFGGAFTLPTQ